MNKNNRMTNEEIVDWLVRNRNYDYSGIGHFGTPTVEETVPVPESLIDEIIEKLKDGKAK